MYVYFIRCLETPFVKIGKARDVEKRLDELQTGCPQELSIMMKINCVSDLAAFDIERKMHKSFSFYKYRSEWFQISGGEFQKIIAQIDIDNLEVTLCEFKKKFIMPKAIRKAKRKKKTMSKKD